MSNEKTIIRLPFAGFYESIHDGEIDRAMELDVEHMVSSDNEHYPAAVGMSERKISEIMHDLADWSVAHEAYAKSYVSAFVGYVKQETSFDLSIEFEKMESPREYNFETDRIFAHIPVSVVVALRAAVTLGNLAEVIRERHQSRSGFCSFYTTDIEAWTAKPVEKWDHNELETLLIAWMRQEIAPDADERINDDVISYDTEMGLNAWQECVKWYEFNEKCEQAKRD